MKRKRVVITGGAGFLGSYLCQRLVEEQHDVVCIDNFLTGNIENIRTFLDEPNFHLIEHDVCDPLNIVADEIYNLACPASPVHYQHDPIRTVKTNVLGTLNMLEQAQVNQAKFFQASTSEVYGDPQKHPQVESYWGYVNPTGIRSCYDEGKRCAETLCFDFHRRYAFPIRVGRIFNTYGPRMHPEDGRVVSNFIVQALESRPITIYGDGMQTRSFCFVDDLIKGILAFMRLEGDIVGPLNLGNPVEYSMLELAREVIALTGSSSPLVFETLPQDDPKQRRPDIAAARRLLHWEPQVDLKEGLRQTIAYFAMRLGNDINAFSI